MKKFTYFLVFFVITLTAFLFWRFSLKDNGQMYKPYPNTSDAPILEFYWENDQIPQEVTRVTPYGVWEGMVNGAYEPANEMQFYIKDSKKPIFAAARGIVVLNEKRNKMIVIAYGRNYGVTYHHIVDVLSNIRSGEKVEAGQLLGYTEIRAQPDFDYDEATWEIELDYKKGDVFRSLPPYEYFSKSSQKKLDKIISNAKYGGGDEWTITKGCSWIKYLDSPEWWTSPIRVGYSVGGDTEQEFINSLGLGWKNENEMGRVFGPKDVCR